MYCIVSLLRAPRRVRDAIHSTIGTADERLSAQLCTTYFLVFGIAKDFDWTAPYPDLRTNIEDVTEACRQ